MKVNDIASILNAEITGDGCVEISGVASLEKAVSGELSFLEKDTALVTDASAVIVPKSFSGEAAVTLIKVDNPKIAFSRIAREIVPEKKKNGRDDSAIISPTAQVHAAYIGPHVSIGDASVIEEGSELHAGVRIGEGVTIGKFTILRPNCVIYDGAVIGSNCVIHAGTVIGSDGFGYVTDDRKEHHQFPQFGSVVLEDNVEIGAGCCVDRGSLGVTEIGEGTKIDNLVQIAHNVQIGKRVLIAAQTGIAGSSTIEDDVIIGGQVGIGDHVTIRSGAVLGSKSGVFPNKILKPGFWYGIPAEPIADFLKGRALLRKITRQSKET